MNGSKYDSILRAIYYDSRHPAAFSSAANLFKAAKQINTTIKHSDVKNWLLGEFTYTLHKPVRRKIARNKIIVEGIDVQWEGDLVDMQEFSRQNSGYKYILTIIDVFSKYAWSVPIKNKTAKSIIDAFSDVFNEGRVPKYLRTDMGREFKNIQFRNFLEKYGVEHFTSHNRDIKCAVVERFNRTLKSKMFKYFTSKGTRRYVDILPDLIIAYNSTKHRSIKMRPIDVNLGNEEIVFSNLYDSPSMRHLIRSNKVKSKLTINDTVRKQYEKKPFDKSYYPNWTDQIFTVKTLSKSYKQPMHRINDESLQRYYNPQLQKVKENLYRVERIIRSKLVNGKRMHFVKWLNYGDEWNSWIPDEEIRRL